MMQLWIFVWIVMILIMIAGFIVGFVIGYGRGVNDTVLSKGEAREYIEYVIEQTEEDE